MYGLYTLEIRPTIYQYTNNMYIVGITEIHPGNVLFSRLLLRIFVHAASLMPVYCSCVFFHSDNELKLLFLFIANQQVTEPPAQQQPSRDRTSPTFGSVGAQYAAHT